MLEFPPLVLPAGGAEPEGGVVEAVVVVGVDGTATLDACLAGEELCALLRDALPAARFEPARRGDAPIPARVRIALRVASPEAPGEPPATHSGAPDVPGPSETDGARVPDAGATQPGEAPAADAGTTEQPQPSAASATAPEPRAEAETHTYGARGRVVPAQPGMRRLELTEMRDMPGAFGDPFRAVEALPGIVSLFSGLPYIYVRGSPPTGTQYYYDGVPVPALFHLALGPAVIHPRMVGPIRLYSGGAPARYGRLTGGVIVGEGPGADDGDLHAEAELRLIDVSGYVQTDALGGRLAVSGRYGYPALVLSLAVPEISLAYWDYQLRYSLPLSANDSFELVSLGSYDAFGQRGEPDSQLTLTFHRLEPRWLHRTARDELGVALMLGWERSGFGDDLQVEAFKLMPRTWFEHRFEGRSWLRLSADAQSAWGGLLTSGIEQDKARELGLARIGRGQRSVLGAQAELGLRPWTALELQLGARLDAWLQADLHVMAVDPRARVIVHASDEVDLHVATGLVHQPAVAYLPLPALADFADLRTLQSALQSEAGVGWNAPGDLRLEVQAFVHRYRNLIFTDLRLLQSNLESLCEARGCGDLRVPDQLDGWSYGAEVFIRRPITHALSGFVSYTLAWSRVDRVLGLPYTPSWDVRHVGNLVLQWQIGGGFSAGLRAFFRTGKIDGSLMFRQGLQLEQQRLPGFFRLDLQAAYAWSTGWGRMRFGVEWLNATLSREPQEYRCNGMSPGCTVDYLPAIFIPNLSLRAEH